MRKAELDLEHTRIDAPIGGRIGGLLVHEGDVVKANETTLVTLNQIAPIDVRFTVPEQQLPAVQAALAAGTVPVTAHPGGSPEPPETGQLVFVDNAVDRTTGTIALKGRFENAQRHLWPGEYVDVVMQIGTRVDAVVVPERAVQAGQDGDIVFVVGADDKAQVRKVRVDLTHRGSTVIAEGIEPGRPRRGRRAAPALARGRGDGRGGAGPGRRPAGRALVNVAEPFIRRPVMTTLLMSAVLLFGVAAYRELPVSDLPNVDFPTLLVSATLPGTDPETMASAVATPLERAFSTIAGIDAMSSVNALGTTQITVQFTPRARHRLRRTGRAGSDLRRARSPAARPPEPARPGAR